MGVLWVAALLVALPLGTSQTQPKSSISAWCSLDDHASAKACSPPTTCQSTDNWWADASSCAIPGGNPLVYPYNYDTWNVCGGSLGVQTMPLQDDKNQVFGKIYLFRDYRDNLFITVTIDGAINGQYFTDMPNPASPDIPWSTQVLIWDELPIVPADKIQYKDPANVGRFSCFTYLINLQHVCDPITSYYRFSPSGFGSDNYYCLCYDPSKPCPTRDLSKKDLLFLSLKVNATLYSLQPSGCGAPTSSRLMGSAWNNAFLGQVSVPCNATWPPASAPRPPSPPRPRPPVPPT
eukprot:CAMPEP_0202902654 /NCGR_PEP_ID=MMETSP1392-20130828/16978_1 /ASSEMBLY_ACC=CAM_ASM_000868 /TAXON_ID=225041 /ORGANISM="Chlamydomonas chlamydogama, Strain SAG 11-48b" /LENGTH=291 /DNA_ID=CAMNT_0049589449 /DNA_START=184 /DNA_END=1055 /DNA_ORIENTATION=-